MRIKSILLIAMCALLAGGPVFADLGDFKDAIDNSEKEKDPSPEPDTRSDEEKEMDSELFIAMLELWFWVNLAANYDSYPYATGPYVDYHDWDGPLPAPRKPYRLSIEQTSFFATDNTVSSDPIWGARTAIEGKIIPLLGPRASVLWLWDGSERTSLSSAGLTVSLFQNRFLSTDVYFEWIAWKGFIEDTGYAMGFEFNSWPAKPVSLHVRIGTQIFDGSGAQLEDWSAGLGYHISRWELRAGWQSLAVSDSNYRFGGPYLGAAVHF